METIDDGKDGASVPVHPPMPAGADAIAIVNLVLNQIHGVETRIKERIDKNAEAAKNRWGTHESEHIDMAKAIKELRREFEDHLDAEEREDLIYAARIGPVKSAGSWMFREWRTILLAGLATTAIIGQVIDRMNLAQ